MLYVAYSDKYAEQDPEDEDEDHEEEFYYTEVEVTVDTVTQTFADMHTSSPPQHGSARGGGGDPLRGLPMMVSTLPDHDYQKKVRYSAITFF